MKRILIVEDDGIIASGLAYAFDLDREHIRSCDLASLALEPVLILLDVKNQRAEIFGETELFCDKHWTAEALTNVIKKRFRVFAG